MTTRNMKPSVLPSHRLWAAVWKDWVAGAVLVVVWVALWTSFTAGVLGPASTLVRKAPRAEGRVELPAAPQMARWVPAP